MNERKHGILDEEFEIYRKAIIEFANTVENELQISIYIKESRKYIQFLITYYLRLGRLGEVKEKINALDLFLLDEIDSIQKRLNFY
ncbi:MAG: hypothetical protein LBT29_05210 [Flavobacteriaceae bacterium]|jgi:hypothetical protein|nr:hypothetical protein [Flavobacteriaceae bacterium]